MRADMKKEKGNNSNLAYRNRVLLTGYGAPLTGIRAPDVHEEQGGGARRDSSGEPVLEGSVKVRTLKN